VATHLQLGLINLMAAAEQTVELIATKEIDLFLPVMREIDFGDAFLLLMLHWCGIGNRSKPLEYWQVFLLRAKSEIIVACCQAYETLKPVRRLRYSLKRPFT
jgi:hypothetical protein